MSKYKSLISKTPMKFSQMSKDRQYHIKSVEKAKSKALSKAKGSISTSEAKGIKSTITKALKD